ncbi:MAG: pantetheine-phosphate adenylyltransferase [Armatimonadota bacterium]
MKKAIYPGSFDPVTNGHLDLIERASRVFDEVIVSVACNTEKTPLFSIEERVKMLQDACGHLDNVTVDYFKGLLVDYAKKHEAKAIIKGLRAVSDFEFELQMALMNKRLNNDIETMFIMTAAEYSFLSSSIVKELAIFGAELKGLVPEGVEKLLKEKLDISGQEA